MRRIGVFGWGIVAPGAHNVGEFADILDQSAQASRLVPFEGFGPSNFLVGKPSFRFDDYEAWISARFAPNRFRALDKKFGTPTKYAVGAFIQALGQNAGVEEELRSLGEQAQVIVGGGLTDVPTYDAIGRDLHRAQRRWDRFWCNPVRNEAHRRHLEGQRDPEAPLDPELVDEVVRDEAEEAYWHYWAARSAALHDYLGEYREIEAETIGPDVGTAKGTVIRNKQRRLRDLNKKWGTPTPPWDAVSADALWNIASSPASQISMLGKIRGAVYAPMVACSAFGYALKLGMDAIRKGEAKLVVVGATDPEPTPLSVGTFYTARVLSHDGEVSRPLTGLKGTHVAGGSAVWILGDLEHYVGQGWTPLGMEPLGVGLTADADHIITPSKEGPTAAIHQALETAGVKANEVRDWDLHATGTPGDATEIEIVRDVLSPEVRLTARKAFFGHGMGAGGGWELTAQYLGVARGSVYPTALTADDVHPAIAAQHERFVYGQPCEVDGDIAGKLSMGVGGLNAAVISRRLGA